MIYFIVPKLWSTELYSKKLANIHFWIGILGILFYYVSMLAAGITQGLMWRAVDANGSLVYPDFVETVIRILPLFLFRALGGVLFLGGFVLMLYNVYKTIKQAPKELEEETVQVKISSSAPVHRNGDIESWKEWPLPLPYWRLLQF